MTLARLIVPSICILIGVVYLIMTLTLPAARLGDADAPKYFPMIVAIFFIVMSIVYFIKEFLAHYEVSEDVKKVFKKDTLILIIATLVFSLIYTLIFERLGYLISTILFLGVLLFLVNGKNKWLTNILVSVLFSIGTWYVFTQLLDVSLP
ncbi:tripartite tricarboxylate transporter TctB family protein [Ureibacillus sp. MALMAid1270]|uniref:tripartite tricarboxylate transporter TctB family protein n=1 Tax=Ureibacillus sp. MALMAid1270 TaxID=3411629 RepID=UPI003BA738B4